eukprot:1157550-Pelagomonas_calceolata.AAC.8
MAFSKAPVVPWKSWMPPGSVVLANNPMLCARLRMSPAVQRCKGAHAMLSAGCRSACWCLLHLQVLCGLLCWLMGMQQDSLADSEELLLCWLRRVQHGFFADLGELLCCWPAGCSTASGALLLC